MLRFEKISFGKFILLEDISLMTLCYNLEGFCYNLEGFMSLRNFDLTKLV